MVSHKQNNGRGRRRGIEIVQGEENSREGGLLFPQAEEWPASAARENGRYTRDNLRDQTEIDDSPEDGKTDRAPGEKRQMSR